MPYDPLAGAQDMVERVAIAISLADDDNGSGCSVADYYRMLARSALLAMVRPTREMTAALVKHFGEEADKHLYTGIALEGYEVMIAAARAVERSDLQKSPT